MREIKFRAWDIEGEQYLYNVYIVAGSLLVALDEDEPNALDDMGSVDDFVIEQYTGLKDKNGKEIYEGDIVYDWREHQYFQVAYEQSDCSFSLLLFPQKRCELYEVSWLTNDKSLEIFGNIHEIAVYEGLFKQVEEK